MICKAFLAAILVSSVYSIPIDNGIIGEPEIDCGPSSIRVTFNTQNPFSGHVYVQGEFAKENSACRSTGDGTRSVGTIELDFLSAGSDACNVKRERSLEPKGVYVRANIVASFHPNFLTKVDRAYTIQCFYMEADKTVSASVLDVSAITTGFQTQFVPMPVCRYEILDGPEGNVVEYATIGQPVYHKWTCDTDTVDTFCMNVHSCFVVDPAGEDRLDLIDEDGCALDKYVLGNLDYTGDLTALKEVHVFKYADRPATFFQCQVTLLVKEPNGECVRPVCPDPPGRGAGGARRARSAVVDEAGLGTVDVSRQLDTLDISTETRRMPNYSMALLERPDGREEAFCVSPTSLWTFTLFVVVILSVTVSAGILLTKRSSQKS